MRILKSALIVFFVFHVPSLCHALDIIKVDTKADNIEIGRSYIQIFEDTSASLLIDSVIGENYSKQFKTNTKSYPTNYNTSSAYWIRFKIKNTSNSSIKRLVEVLDPHIDNLSFYHPDKYGFYKSFWSGYGKKFKERNYAHKNFIFEVFLEPQQEKTLYLRFKSRAHVGFFFKVRSSQYFTYYALSEYYLLGIYYGILVIMALYNLFIFFSTRERVYVYYVLYVLSCALLSLLEDGTGFQYIWPSLPKLNIFLAFVSRVLLITFFYLYSHTFLNLNKYLKKVNIGIFVSVIVYIIFHITQRLHKLYDYADLFFLIPFVAIYVSSILVWRRGYRPARYFVLGYTIVLMSIIVIVLRDQAVLFNNMQNAFVDKVIVYSLNIGIVLEIVVLSFALGDRIKYLKIDRERAQKRIINQLRENEKLKDKVNRELEEKVQERTVELKEKNKAIIDSINYAQRIQETILPSEKLLQNILGEHFIYYKPKDIVSGDFYWATELLDKRVLFTAVDCTGHGVPGAFMSLMSHNVLKYCVKEKGLTKPNKILKASNIRLNDSMHQKDDDFVDQFGMDLALCVLDRENLKVEYAGAYNSLIIVRDGQVLEVKADRVSIGNHYASDKNYDFKNHVIDVQKSDKIFLFSDGYADQFGGPKKRKFMYDNFLKLLVATSKLPMNQQYAHLDNTLKDWQKDFPQIDDILVMGITV